MKKIFEKLGELIYVQNKHFGYKIKWSYVSSLIQKWSRNRQPDSSRIQEMTVFYKNGGYIPPILHLAELKDEKLVCYDGNHRREVFDILKDPDLTIIADCMFDVTQTDVYFAFENINKSIQVPALYFEDVGVKEEILQLVKEYETNHPQFISTSPRYHSPNFNRDIFIDDVFDIYKQTGYPIQEIKSLLMKLNDAYKSGKLCKSHDKYKKSAIDKCAKYDFYLFLERRISSENLIKLKNNNTSWKKRLIPFHS